MHVLVEPSFMASHWCTQYIKGITSQTKRKNMTVEIHTDMQFIYEPAFDDTHVILLGSSLTWASHYLARLHAAGVHPIVLSIANYQSTFPFASFITMDYEDASHKLMKYLRGKGCTATAYFAGSQKSSTDLQKERHFLQGGGKENDIYNYTGSLKETCDNLLTRIGEYDSILCANDVCAVVLIRRLLNLGYRIPEDIHVATFGDTVLSNLEVQNIAMAQIKSFEAGKLSISAYRMLKANPAITSLSLLLHCDILDCNSNLTDIRSELSPPSPAAQPSFNFFHDPEVEKVLLVEKLLSGCDKLDISILREVLNRESYSKIAAKLFIAENTISYRIKKILSLAPEKSKEEIFSLLSQFLF